MKLFLKWAFATIGLLVLAVVIAAFNAQTGAGAILATPFILAGFTEEQSKSFSEFMSKQSSEIQDKVKGLVEAAKQGELINELKALLKGDGTEKQGIADLIPVMQKQLDDQNLLIQKMELQKKNEETPTLEKALHQLFDSKDFKDAKAKGFREKSVFEVKADTTNITGTVNMTMQSLSVKFNPERALAFIPYMNTGFVGAEKNRVLWVEGTFTSNVGYVAQGTGQATADAGTAAEKSRAMAKISAKLPLTAELLEDADYIASAFRMKMQEKALIFADGECYDGDGDDSTNPSHIYGIQGQSTAYSVATTGSADTVEKPNIGDVVDDAVLQAELSEQRGLNKIWMNPKDFARFRKAKDQNGQYLFIKDVNGSYTINGLDVVKTTKVASNTLLVGDSSKMQLWWKRNVEVKFSQMNGTDFVDDAYTAVLFLRNQVVIEGPDQTALIYVSDIDAAIAALEKVTA